MFPLINVFPPKRRHPRGINNLFFFTPLLEKEAQKLCERLALEEAEAMEMEDEEIKAANMNIEKEVG